MHYSIFSARRKEESETISVHRQFLGRSKTAGAFGYDPETGIRKEQTSRGQPPNSANRRQTRQLNKMQHRRTDL